MRSGLKERIQGLLPEGAVVFAGATIVGMLTGAGTFFLRRGIAWMGDMLSVPLHPGGLNWIFIVYAVIAILGAVFYQKAVGENLADGTSQLRSRLADGNFKFRRNHLFSPLMGCLVTIGFGASAGAEGPCAFSGAAIGDRVARLMKFSPSATRILFGCGAAAGIAGIFKSPLGGVFFAIEVLRMEMSVIGMVSLTCASLSAFGVAYVLGGYTWNVRILTDMHFIPDHFGWIALLGIVCGFYSIYYSYTLSLASRFLRMLGNVWLRGALCGLGLGIVIMMFSAMFGEGYDVVSNIVNGVYYRLVEYGPFFRDLPRLPLLLGIITAMLLLKGAVVGAVNSGGGVAGEFVPAIFAGCLLGFMFASVSNIYGIGLPIENFALIGTAAVMAGTIKAPLMAIFIAAEVSDRYGFILGFMLAAGISYGIVMVHSLLISTRKARATRRE